MDLDAALQAIADFDTEGIAFPSQNIGRHHPALQSCRAKVGWTKRRRHSEEDGRRLQILETNHTKATRSDDVIPLTGESYNRIKGQGQWKKFTCRSFLRAAFSWIIASYCLIFL